MPLTTNIVFFGSPFFAVRILEAILGSERRVSLVVTKPDQPAGRGMQLKAPAIKEFAVEKGLRFIQPPKMKEPSFHKTLCEVGAEIFVVAAYGRILPSAILTIPKITLNVHASLLPRWRGAAPIERAILAGDSVTGVSIMKLVEEMDAGDVMLMKQTPIDPNETAFELEERLATIGSEALVEALDLIDRGQDQFHAQDVSKVTFAPPLKSEEGKIDWSKSALEIINQVRALLPWPGTYTGNGSERIKIFKATVSKNSVDPTLPPGTVVKTSGGLRVSCKDGWVEILELQREGRKRQGVSEFLAGYRLTGPQRWQ